MRGPSLNLHVLAILVVTTMGHPDRLASTIDHPDGGAASCPAQLRKARSVGKWNFYCTIRSFALAVQRSVAVVGAIERSGAGPEKEKVSRTGHGWGI